MFEADKTELNGLITEFEQLLPWEAARAGVAQEAIDQAQKILGKIRSTRRRIDATFTAEEHQDSTPGQKARGRDQVHPASRTDTQVQAEDRVRNQPAQETPRGRKLCLIPLTR